MYNTALQFWLPPCEPLARKCRMSCCAMITHRLKKPEGLWSASTYPVESPPQLHETQGKENKDSWNKWFIKTKTDCLSRDICGFLTTLLGICLLGLNLRIQLILIIRTALIPYYLYKASVGPSHGQHQWHDEGSQTPTCVGRGAGAA